MIPAKLKLVVIGNSGVGKTSLCRRFALGLFEESYKSTIGADFYTRRVKVDGGELVLIIWDLAGQERFGFIRSSFYAGSKGVVVVFSLVDRKSFEDVPGWVREARDNVGEVPILLVGSKKDLGAEVDRSSAEDMVRKLGLIGYVETSAKTGEGVEDAFMTLTKKVISSGQA